MNTTTQATIEVSSVPARFELPERTAVLLNNEGLRSIGAALAAIKTCTDLLNHNQSEAGEGNPAFDSHVTSGLLAAIATCAQSVEAHVNGHEPDGVLVLKGEDAKEVDDKAWRAWHRNFAKLADPQ